MYASNIEFCFNSAFRNNRVEYGLRKFDRLTISHIEGQLNVIYVTASNLYAIESLCYRLLPYQRDGILIPIVITDEGGQILHEDIDILVIDMKITVIHDLALYANVYSSKTIPWKVEGF